jgi:heme-degrading monooxygenase HmoA
MILRILMVNVVPERLEDWLAYTKTIGFPGMRAQPGCRGIMRLKQHEGGFAILTIWDSLAAFEAFKASPAMGELGKAAQGLTIRPYSEILFDIVGDDGDVSVLLAGA